MYKDVVYSTTYEEVLEETGNPDKADSIAETQVEYIAVLIDKLRFGACPTSWEKRIIRDALMNFCTSDQKDLVKGMFPKLRMRWTSSDEKYLCVK
jgi:hypothetical protein